MSTKTNLLANIGFKSAPRKPERSKSGSLKIRPTPTVSHLDSKSSTDRKKGFKSLQESGSVGKDDDDGEDKWCALNDSKPDTVKRRVRRIIRTNSDSDLSEASTIDSSAGLSAKGTGRKEEIRARKVERRAQKAQHKEGKDLEKNGGNDEHLDEDEELVDTDKDLPISEELELALRKKRLENRHSNKKRRGKSPHGNQNERVRSNRRGGKKEVVLASPIHKLGEDRSHVKCEFPNRTNSLDGVRRKKKPENLDVLFVENSQDHEKKLIRSASADRIRRDDQLMERLGSSSGFNMLLDDCQNDSMMKVIPPRHLSGDSVRGRNSSRPLQHNTTVQSNSFIADSKDRKYSGAIGFGGSEPPLAKKIRSRCELLQKSGKANSDRFLCTSKTTDFAPRISSRSINVSGHDDSSLDQKPKGILNNFIQKDSVMIRKMKKDGSKSVDGVPKRRNPKHLQQ